MQRVHWLNRKTFKIRNVYLFSFIFSIFFLTIYGTIQLHLQGEAIKMDQAESQRLLDEILAGDQKETEPLTNNPLQPKVTDSGTSTKKQETMNPQGDANMPDMDYTIRTFDPETEINIMTYKYPSGIYQGMTYTQAHTAWKAKKDEIYERLYNNINTMTGLSDALIDSSKAERSTMLSLLKKLDPEDLALAEEVLIKSYPEEADELKSFFNDIDKATPKSLDEISSDADFILNSDEVNKIARKQNHQEFEKIMSELDQVETEKPIIPNL